MQHRARWATLITYLAFILPIALPALAKAPHSDALTVAKGSSLTLSSYISSVTKHHPELALALTDAMPEPRGFYVTHAHTMSEGDGLNLIINLDNHGHHGPPNLTLVCSGPGYMNQGGHWACPSPHDVAMTSGHGVGRD